LPELFVCVSPVPTVFLFSFIFVFCFSLVSDLERCGGGWWFKAKHEILPWCCIGNGP
jgi:hypothetical protein